MLTPSEIDLLRQDLRAALKLLGQDEIDDAHTLMRHHCFRPDDFEFSQYAEVSPAFPSDVAGTVTLTRKSNQIAKRYVVGGGASWLLELESDLKQEVFGPKTGA